MDKIQNQREKCLESFKSQSIKKDPISWHLWKRAFDEGVRYQKELVKNNCVLDDVISCKNLDDDFSEALNGLADKTRKTKPNKKF